MFHTIAIRPSALLSVPLALGTECFASDPTPQPEPDVKIEQVAAGIEHTCVVAQARRVRCWGAGAHGKLGHGDDADIGDDELPYEAGDLDLGGFGPIAQLVGHDGHTCALNTRGKVRCWGYGPILGIAAGSSIGDDESPSTAATVELGNPATQLAANALRTCALLVDNTVRCWGDNSGGELGYGHLDSIGDDETPAQAGPVPLGALAKAIAGGGDHFCAITEAGDVRCWGQNNNGQLGQGHTEPVGDDETPAALDPVDLGGATAVQLALGGAHTCALTEDNHVRCWGLNKYGQLGLGHTADIGDDEAPAAAASVQVDSTRQVIQIAAGAVHTCAVLDDGGVKCWGYGFQGQLGYGNGNSIGDDESPADVPDVDVGSSVVQLAMGTHTCALLSTGRIRCWGLAGFGQLGYGNQADIGLENVPADAGDVLVF